MSGHPFKNIPAILFVSVHRGNSANRLSKSKVPLKRLPQGRCILPVHVRGAVSSTADEGESLSSSPVLPSLRAPQLPARALEYLRASTPSREDDPEDESRYVTASWGSPYPKSEGTHLGYQSSSSSELSEEDSPLHHLEITTPFLRPAPPVPAPGSDTHQPSLSGSAHTTKDLSSEHRHWLSDGTDESEHSSLNGSVSGDDTGWFEEKDPATPRASACSVRVVKSITSRHPRSRSSNETLKQAAINNVEMDVLSVAKSAQDASSIWTNESLSEPTTSRRDSPVGTDEKRTNGSVRAPGTLATAAERPATPQKPVKTVTAQTPRLKKKVPWRGKNILVLLPRDEERGQPGKAPIPLTEERITAMLQSWEQLGYDVRGFDLDGGRSSPDALVDYSQSRELWPDLEDMVQERARRNFEVTLPDLNAWNEYAKEFQEAKLRALGVSSGGDEPAPLPSISPAATNLSRQNSNQYSPLPFSPPIPTSSAASNVPQGFPFPAPFLSGNGSSATQSPALPSVASPASFNAPPLPGKYNPRASIAISPGDLPFHSGQPSPHGWSPQMLLQQHLGRTSSPSVFNMNALMSPGLPFQRDGISPVGMHQRHQSLQYPVLPHQHLQRQDSARASPRLQDLREVDEEIQSNPYEKSPSPAPEPSHPIRHNASNSLQKEIDDAEYHLEEQFRSQLEEPDYNPPHNESEQLEVSRPTETVEALSAPHARGPSVHFSGFGTDPEDGPKLHHPQPHSRGHSLSQQPYFDNDEMRDSSRESKFRNLKPEDLNLAKTDESFEIETNPSNLGTPIESFDLVNQMHQRTMSTMSNPWANEPVSNNKMSSRHTSHASKPSLSKLNAAAAEFKLNPTSSFSPEKFAFGNTNNTPSNFQPNPPQSATPSHFSMPSTSSSKGRINPSAPTFSPTKSTFSFSPSGPKFNPDAPSFQPLSSIVSSVASPPASVSESGTNRPGPIFGNININLSEVVKPAKKSKAVPIVRPVSHHASSPAPASASVNDDTGDRPIEDSRAKKKFRDNSADGDQVPLFAEPTPEPEPVTQGPTESIEEERLVEQDAELPKEDRRSEEKADEEDSALIADITLASTAHSESTDGKVQSESNTKATTSPSATSPDQDHANANWAPFEFGNQSEIQSFNDARPFGEDDPTSNKGHKKSLSANAKPFVPGGFMFGAQHSATFEPNPGLPSAPMVEQGSEEERAGSPTPAPELPPTTEPRVEVQSTPGADSTSSPQSVHAPPVRGLGSSRFASPPTSRGLAASQYAATPSPQPRTAGLAASRFAASPSSVSEDETVPIPTSNDDGIIEPQALRSFEPLPVSPPSVASDKPKAVGADELTFEEIDEVMEHLHKKDPTMGVKRTVDSSKWRQPTPVPNASHVNTANSPPVQPQPQAPFRSDAPSPSPSPQQYRSLAQETAPAMPSTEFDDPFVERPQSALSQSFDGPIYHLDALQDIPESEWDQAFSASEQDKLEQRVHYLSGHVNDLVGNILASRLNPLEKTLENIHLALGDLAHRTHSTRRGRRSLSAEFQESDADDEDEEVPVRRSMSPRRDRRMEQIRIAVLDALNQQQTSRALEAAQLGSLEPASNKHESAILKAMEDIKAQFGQSPRSEFSGEQLRNIVEEAVEKHMLPAPVVKGDEEANNKLSEMQARIYELEQRLQSEEGRTESERGRVRELEEKLRIEESRGENETNVRRGAEERVHELRRQLEQAETKVEVEIMNRSIFDQRVHDLEERLKIQESRTEVELSGRRDAEDRLSEIQRLLRISSEEEDRLRAVLDERDQKIKAIEQSYSKNAMRLTLVEADKVNAEQTEVELKKRLHAVEAELRESMQETKHWRTEAEVARETSQRQTNDLVEAVNETRHLHKLIDTLGVQLEENERIRDNWRAKFVSLQDDMAHAAREITEENSRRSKKEQALLARQEVLDARLQAEARTRERLEVEVERLENGERQGLRAVSECKRLEGILNGLRNENHRLHQDSLSLQRELQDAQESAAKDKARFQRELEEARDAAASEVQRMQISVQSELDAANNQVNVVREELEDEVNKVRAQLDQVRLDADTARAHHEMMLEEAQNSKKTELEEMARKHQSEVEDIQARYERQLGNTTEDAQRTEQNLLERLSLSTSKIEHLQDRVVHLEDKVQIAQEAARAAAQAAAQAGKSPSAPITESSLQPTPAVHTKQLAEAMQLPEKISPQALRESIMVLQEQLQAREQRIEELEQTVEKLDPDALNKISKRDDEITWLRELLAVRHGDLQDIISALSAEHFDRESVKGAAIRLKANLQMEEQERERAMNGGSAINLPSIAATIRGAATPRVAQAVGPLAAAWGSWRKASQPARSTTSNASSSPAAGRNATPSKTRRAPQNSFLSGLMTPPASGIRTTPQAEQNPAQPTAFGNTGRRFTAEEFASRSRGPAMTARQAEKMPVAVSTPPPRQEHRDPTTPPMMRSGSYDADAQVEDFDDASFFDD
ncbi:hypothetical protein DL764_005529 [Monosporascus ibericus]|uniref:Myosin class II heavy chain n=1 Tax=Monosporascus ibericus TaxID=155417 RepID=A0A4Q4TCI6_9PEZI|nr:hypothetical protein DL764_005529 [Monosporascus ibericus]